MQEKKCHANSPAELQQDLSAIEEELKAPVDAKKMRKLFQKLETAQKDYSSLKTRYNVSAEKFLFGFEERICSLFGAVMTTHVDSEVEEILQTALKLAPTDNKGARSVNKKILQLKSWHRPSKENLQKLALAEDKLMHVSDSCPLKEDESDCFEAMELLELASSVYHKNKEERNKIYACLSEHSKQRFQKHLISLKATAFAKEETTIQALFVSAFELAGIPARYPSPDEIQEFFSEDPTKSNAFEK